MKFNNPYWGEKTKIELLQKWILVHSFLYYELNRNIVSDSMYDQNSKQLAELMVANKKEAKASKWHYAFFDFTGATGFHLWSRLTKEDQGKISHVGMHVAARSGQA